MSDLKRSFSIYHEDFIMIRMTPPFQPRNTPPACNENHTA